MFAHNVVSISHAFTPEWSPITTSQSSVAPVVKTRKFVAATRYYNCKNKSVGE